MKGIHIVCVSNDSFAKYLGVMLTSLLENKTSKEPITIYIIDGGIAKNKKKKLKRLRQKYNANLKFLSINQNYYDDLKMRGHVSKETYYRISIPNLLSRDIKKVIYLDSDLVIKDNIANLWNVNVENHYLAAAEDPVGTTGEDKGRFGMRCKALSIPEKYNYFNAGVMLMNLEKWRKDHIPAKVFRYIRNHPSKIVFWDQDALNAVLYHNWFELKPRWNLQKSYYRVRKNKYVKAMKNPAIIHFSGPKKPWHKNNDQPLKHEYYKYLNIYKKI